MIFDEIVLHNFGVYRGRHVVQLAPPSPRKPVILIGGLNGGGKTTFLDAIHLGLYGKRARCSNRGALPYDEYLRRSINRDVDPSDGAAVEVQFRQRSEGEEHVYRIHRSWSAGTNGANERVEVVRDGVYDRVLTDAWPEVIEEFIPVSMSNLFFFDGEKIEEFADLENSTRLLSTAVNSLLGLDLVDRLATDLGVLEGRHRHALKNDLERRQIEEAEAELGRLESLRQDVVARRAGKQNEVDRLEKCLREIDSRYTNEGGRLYEGRQGIHKERSTAERRLRQVEEDLRELAAGAAPLLLVEEFLAAADRQARVESAAQQASTLNQVLIDRDARLLEKARSYSAPPAVITRLDRFLSADRGERAATARAETYLHLEAEGRETLSRLVEFPLLSETRKQIFRLVRESDEIKSQLVDLDRKIAGIPAEEALKPIIEELHATKAALDREKMQLAALDLELERATRERDQKRAVWVTQAEKTLEKRLEQDDVERIVSHSQAVQRTLKRFRVAVVERHVSRIEQLVLDSFRQLLRKKSLISGLKIDPQRFSLELIGNDGSVISPDRLSAGERQLLAVSMLWGLARASGRPLPAVIDTPLGRLDAAHRINLIERYFPFASHQVLLLSTDEEIDERYYETLKPWIGHTYNLEFDDARGVTEIRSGYFW